MHDFNTLRIDSIQKLSNVFMHLKQKLLHGLVRANRVEFQVSTWIWSV